MIGQQNKGCQHEMKDDGDTAARPAALRVEGHRQDEEQQQRPERERQPYAATRLQ
jgi:hypothetical protein